MAGEDRRPVDGVVEAHNAYHSIGVRARRRLRHGWQHPSVDAAARCARRAGRSSWISLARAADRDPDTGRNRESTCQVSSLVAHAPTADRDAVVTQAPGAPRPSSWPDPAQRAVACPGPQSLPAFITTLQKQPGGRFRGKRHDEKWREFVCDTDGIYAMLQRSEAKHVTAL